MRNTGNQGDWKPWTGVPADLQQLHWCDTPAEGETHLLSSFISDKATARSIEITVSGDKTTRSHWKDNSSEILRIKPNKNSFWKTTSTQIFSLTSFKFNLIFIQTYHRKNFSISRDSSTFLEAGLCFSFCTVKVKILSVSCRWLKCSFELAKQRLCNCSKENDSCRRVWTSHSRGFF